MTGARAWLAVLAYPLVVLGVMYVLPPAWAPIVLVVGFAAAVVLWRRGAIRLGWTEEKPRAGA